MFSRIVGFTWQVGGNLQMISLVVGSEMRLDLEGRGGDKDALTALDALMHYVFVSL